MKKQLLSLVALAAPLMLASAAHAQTAEQIAAAQAAFGGYDADNNGQVSLSEIATFISERLASGTFDTAAYTALFGQLDTNNNGNLSVEEVAASKDAYDARVEAKKLVIESATQAEIDAIQAAYEAALANQ